MGRIIRSDKLPNNKFLEPVNFSKIKANTPFTIKMKLNNLQAGLVILSVRLLFRN